MLNIYQRLGLAVAGTVVALGTSAIESVQAASFKFSFGAPGSEGSLSFSDSQLTGIGRESATLRELEGANFEYYFEDFSSSVPDPLGTLGIGDSYNSQDSSYTPDVSFDFSNGELVGLNLKNSSFLDYSGSGGSRAWSFSGIPYLVTRGDRFIDYFDGLTSVGGFSGCSIDGSRDVCSFDSSVVNSSSQTSATGIFLHTDGYYEEVLEIRDLITGEIDRQVTRNPSVYSTFYSFDNLPRQIAFTTLEAVPRDPAAVPEPSSILGIGAAIAGGSFLKRQQKKAKS